MNEDSLHDDDVHLAQSDPNFFIFITGSVFRLIKNESRDEIKLPFNPCQGLIRTPSKLEHFLVFVISDYCSFLMQ